MLHAVTGLSVPAYLVAVLCLTQIVRRTDSRPPSPCAFTACAPGCRLLTLAGLAGTLLAFLLLPVGLLPAVLPCAMPVAGWFSGILFGSAALAAGTAHRPAGFVAGVLLMPLLSGAVWALCAGYAWRHGLPGNLWSLERFVAVPLAEHATPLAGCGLLCLAGGCGLYCLRILTAAPFGTLLQSALQLAVAQYLVCLFVPMTPLLRLGLPRPLLPAVSVVVSWGCALLVLWGLRVLSCRVPYAVIWGIAGCGALALLLC